MISFYPGPSRVHDEIPQYVRDAFDEGVLSINHRSNEFMSLSEDVISLLKKKLQIPADYTVFYTGSATECWEVIAQSLITQSSYHLFNGAFGQKWYEYTSRLRSGAKKFPFALTEEIGVKGMPFEKEGVICLTQNETSNGTQVSNEIIRSIRKHYPSHLIAVDATSSMAGIFLDFSSADVWFASVQKCFGLPAGLALLVCSPAAMEKALAIRENNHYNSLLFMAEMMKKWQTPFTPNVLNIYLLYRVMNESKSIAETHEQTAKRYAAWIEFFSDKKSLQLLIPNEKVRSFTVIPVKATEAQVSLVKSRAKEKGLLLGEGYGDLKRSTFRIANFPAIKESEIRTLQNFLADYE